jgi:hypothetical protein
MGRREARKRFIREPHIRSPVVPVSMTISRALSEYLAVWFSRGPWNFNEAVASN